jgi:hypothetical protein
MKSSLSKLALALALSITLGLVLSRWVHSFSFGDGGDADFRKIYLISPVGGYILRAGTNHTIDWQVSSNIDYLTIEYSLNNGDDWIVVIKSLKVDSPADYYRWQVPCTFSDTAKIRLTDAYGPDYDTSLEPFSIVDATPPFIKLSLLRNSVWPANGEMVDVGFAFSVSDNCDPTPHVFIKVTSDEPTTGGRVSELEADGKIATGNKIFLRAASSEEGDGRVYVITVTAADTSGNRASSNVAVKVNEALGKEAVDSGQHFDPTATN